MRPRNCRYNFLFHYRTLVLQKQIFCSLVSIPQIPNKIPQQIPHQQNRDNNPFLPHEVAWRICTLKTYKLLQYYCNGERYIEKARRCNNLYRVHEIIFSKVLWKIWGGFFCITVLSKILILFVWFPSKSTRLKQWHIFTYLSIYFLRLSDWCHQLPSIATEVVSASLIKLTYRQGIQVYIFWFWYCNIQLLKEKQFFKQYFSLIIKRPLLPGRICSSDVR